MPTPTNVVRLHHALIEDENQLRYYHPGVGTDPGLVDRLRSGGLGVGLDSNIKSAYSWLAMTYQPGDAICLFGFSRGAYTVRSLAGMLSACGLATALADMAPADRWAEIDRLYDKVYRPPGVSAAAPRPTRRCGFGSSESGTPLARWESPTASACSTSLMSMTGTASTTPGSTRSLTMPGTRWHWMRPGARSPRRCGLVKNPNRVITAACSRCGFPATIVTWAAGICRPGCPTRRCSE